MNYHELIIKRVNNSTGIKSSELALHVMSAIGPGAFNSTEYAKELNYAVKHQEIMELEYIHPAERMNSMYFPIGTRLFSFNGYRFVK